MRHGLLLASASAIALATFTHAIADTAAAPRDGGANTVEEVIVHARNREERLSQAPLVVTAASGAALTQAGITDMTALENLVPNIKVAPGFLLDTLNIRGIGTANANS